MDRDAQDSSEIQAAIRSIITDFRSRHPDMFDSIPPMSFDNYMVTCPELEGHIPIANMPANWDPHAPSYYPNHPPVAMDEYQLRFDDDPIDPP